MGYENTFVECSFVRQWKKLRCWSRYCWENWICDRRAADSVPLLQQQRTVSDSCMTWIFLSDSLIIYLKRIHDRIQTLYCAVRIIPIRILAKNPIVNIRWSDVPVWKFTRLDATVGYWQFCAPNPFVSNRTAPYYFSRVLCLLAGGKNPICISPVFPPLPRRLKASYEAFLAVRSEIWASLWGRHAANKNSWKTTGSLFIFFALGYYRKMEWIRLVGVISAYPLFTKRVTLKGKDVK